MNNLTAQTSGKEHYSSISGPSPSPAPSSRRDWSRSRAAPAAVRSPGVAPRANKALSYPNGNTKHILHRKDRRARIEVTITGSDTLMKRGVALIDDLAGVSFRQMKKSLLQFRLGTLEPQQHLLDDAKEQMSSRGVYGMEMKERARHQEERQQMHRSGQKMTRNRDREGLGLVDWQEVNTITGNALDDLSRRWRGFSWTGKGKA